MRVSVIAVINLEKHIKDLVFDEKDYLSSINPKYHIFYERLFSTQIFNSFLKEK